MEHGFAMMHKNVIPRRVHMDITIANTDENSSAKQHAGLHAIQVLQKMSTGSLLQLLCCSRW